MSYCLKPTFCPKSHTLFDAIQSPQEWTLFYHKPGRLFSPPETGPSFILNQASFSQQSNGHITWNPFIRAEVKWQWFVYLVVQPLKVATLKVATDHTFSHHWYIAHRSGSNWFSESKCVPLDCFNVACLAEPQATKVGNMEQSGVLLWYDYFSPKYC